MKRKLQLCFLHACLLLGIHIVYYNMNLTMPLENEIIGIIGKTHRHFTGPSSYKDSGIVFVNTAYNNALVSAENENGDSINYVITDRELLRRFFTKLSDYGNKHRYILCDLIFDVPSKHDSLLQIAINNVNQLIGPEQSGAEEQRPAVLYSTSGLAEYVTYEGKISKIRLYDTQEEQKTLPALMYEAYTGESITKTWLGLRLQGKYLPNAFYPRYFFNNDNFREKEYSLGKVVQLLELNDSVIYNNFFLNKIIVVGNFETDAHINPLGEKIAGSLILFNTFLSLLENRPAYSIGWFLFIFVCFFFLSLFAMHHGNMEYKSKWQRLLHFLGVSGLCILLCISSDLLFSIYTSILPVILYFETMHLVKSLQKIKLSSSKLRSQMPVSRSNKITSRKNTIKIVTSKKKL